MAEHTMPGDGTTVEVVKIGVRIPVSPDLFASVDKANEILWRDAQLKFEEYGKLVGTVESRIFRYEELTLDEQAQYPVGTCMVTYAGYCIPPRRTGKVMGPSLFRKKPVTIEAWHIPNMPTDAPGMQEQIEAIRKWCGGKHASRGDLTTVMMVPTLEGDMYARTGDWIIRGVAGEFYPCAPDIFDQTYEKVLPNA